MSNSKFLIAGVAATLFTTTAPQMVDAETTLTVVSGGGAYSASQRKAYYEPYMKLNPDVKILEDEWDNSIAVLRVQVDTGNYKGHLYGGNVATALAGCDEGILEPIDWDALGISPDDMLPGGSTECGIATIAYGTVFAYRTDVYPDDPPATWADFWDVEKYPGKRGVRSGVPVGTLEGALIADGVPLEEVYEVLRSPGGIDRAFDKLEEIKDHIIYWETGAHGPQLLADKEVVMTTGWNGRFYNAVAEDNQPFEIVWDGQILDFDYWYVPKGVPDLEEVWKFLAFASSPEAQGDQTNYIAYGPMRKGAEEFVNPDILPHLPTAPQNTQNYLLMDVEFWADQREALSARMATWMAK